MIVTRNLDFNIKENNLSTVKIVCNKSRLIYNKANYIARNHYKETGKWLRYNELYHIFKNQESELFYSISTDSTRQILMLLDRNYKSFFQAIKKYNQDKTRFLGKPRLPGYKEKYYVVVFTGANQIKIKNNFIHFPKKENIIPIKLPDNFKYNKILQVSITPGLSFKCNLIYEIQINKPQIENKDFISIDLGINNLAAITSNQRSFRPILINGRWLKATNQYYNKQKAKLQSKLTDTKTSNKIKSLTNKRNRRVKWFMHNTSKKIIDICIKTNIGQICIGKNKEWKQNINIGKRNNQNFSDIPFNTLITQIKYKASMCGISVIEKQESYTSKCSSLDLESVCRQSSYVGKRVKRGLFKGTDYILNADINGSLNIARKVFDDSFIKIVDRGLVTRPLKVNPVDLRLKTKVI